MDDCMDSVDTEHEGIELYNDLCAIWKSAGMHARNWVTNSKVISDLIPKDDKAVVFDVLAENVSAVKTLGLWWRAEGDIFEFKSSLSVVEKITKRIWLSKISTLFDPLGFITPFTIRARILVQQIWVKGYTWDEVVDNEIKCACLAWLKELSQLPRKSWVTMLIVKHYHEKMGHHGVNHTLAGISSKYWVLCAREAIKEWQNQCAKCKRTRASPGVQLMAPLPDSRVQIPLRAFARIAVDFAGPFITIQGRGKKRQKRYLCLFTCLACRAVHLEMAYGLDTDSFLKAFLSYD